MPRGRRVRGSAAPSAYPLLDSKSMPGLRLIRLRVTLGPPSMITLRLFATFYFIRCDPNGSVPGRCTHEYS